MKELDELNSQISDLKSRINEQTNNLEKSLIQQEHRPFRVVLNLFKYWKNEKKDPKRRASIQAFIWWLISPSTITVASVSIVSIIGLTIAFRANGLLRDQNDKIENQTELIKNQNERIKEQTYLSESSRRATLIFELTSILDEIDEEIDKLPVDSLTPKLSDRLEGRIIALSLSLRPYRYLQDNGTLSKAISPERGQLLISVIASKISMSNISLRGDFSKADLENADLRNTILDRIRLNNSNLSYSDLDKSILSYGALNNSMLKSCSGDNIDFSNAGLERSILDSTTTFSSNFNKVKASHLNIKGGSFLECDFGDAVMPFSDLTGSKFYGSNFTGANLRNSILKKADFTNTIFKNVQLDSAIVDSRNWIDSLTIDSSYKQSLKEKYEVKSINNQFIVLIK